MEIDRFNYLWYEAFGYWLGPDSGLTEWGNWVSDSRRRNSAIVDTLAVYGKKSAEAKDKGRSDYRNNIPTITEFKLAYFRRCKEQDEATAIREGRVCGYCGGDGHVFGLTSQRGHEAKAPERLDEIPADRIPFIYCAPEVWDCPECRAETYHGHPELRDRVRRNCLPDYVPVGHPDNPHDYPTNGARAITDKAIAMRRAASEAGNGDLPRVLHEWGKLSLDDAFPLQDTLKTPINDIDEEERRIDAELAAKFGPR